MHENCISCPRFRLYKDLQEQSIALPANACLYNEARRIQEGW